MVKLSHPHNSIFTGIMSNKGWAGSVLHAHLPPWMSSSIAGALPEPIDGSFVDEELRDSRSDKLFRVQLKSGQPGFVYALLEHKSYSDPGTALQIWKYKTRIWETYAQGKASLLRALPPIFPVVFYHGRPKWSAPDSIAAMLGTDDPRVRAMEPDFGYVLRDLGRIPIEELADDPAARSGLAALRGSEADEQERQLVLPEVLAGLPERSEYAKQVVVYLMDVWRVSVEDLRSAADEGKGEHLVSEVVRDLIDRGEARGLVKGEARGLVKGEARGLVKGEAKGLVKGEAKALLVVLEHRFGPLSRPTVRRVQGASLPQLDAWLAAGLTVSSLAELFAISVSN